MCNELIIFSWLVLTRNSILQFYIQFIWVFSSTCLVVLFRETKCNEACPWKSSSGALNFPVPEFPHWQTYGEGSGITTRVVIIKNDHQSIDAPLAPTNVERCACWWFQYAGYKPVTNCHLLLTFQQPHLIPSSNILDCAISICSCIFC